jgi:drug/metabolite transporter (DMT)-like permease
MQRNGLLLVLVSTLGYACLPLFTKALYNIGGLEPFDILSWRFLLAVPLAWMLIAAFRMRPAISPMPKARLLILGALFSGVATFAFFALQRVNASLYTVLLYTYPAIVALMSAVLGEKLPLRAWMALGLTLVGVVLTVPDLSTGLSGDLLGVLLCLGNAASYAVYLILSARWMKGRAGPVASSWTITGSLIPLAALALVRPLSAPPVATSWLVLLGLAVISTVIPIIAMHSGVQRLGAARASIVATLEPLLVIILAVVLLGEQIAPVQLFGGALILISVLLLTLRR